jgi:hypothetical protein
VIIGIHKPVDVAIQPGDKTIEAGRYEHGYFHHDR